MNQYVRVLIMGVLLGTSFPLSKLAIAELGVWPFRFISSLSALLGLIIIFYKELRTFFSQAIELRSLGILMLLAVPNIFLVPTLNNISLSLTSASNALALVYTMPAMLSLIKMVVDKCLSVNSLLAMLLSLAGIVLLLTNDVFGLGEVVIFLSAAVWACGTFLAGRITLKLPTSVITTVQFFTSFVLVALCFILISPEAMPSNHASYAMTYETCKALIQAVVISIYIGFAANAIVFYIWFSLISERGSEFVAYSSLLSLLIGTAISNLLLMEPVTITRLFSLALIILSVYIVQCKKKRER